MTNIKNIIINMKCFNLSVILIMALFTGLLFPGCVDQEFDEPPTEELSDLEANTTIAELKELHRSGQLVSIDEDLIISGQIVSDDTEGNFFKQIILQDETGGIGIQINQNALQAEYQRNRRIYIKCQGLVIGDYGGFIQLGLYQANGDVGRIPELMVDQFIEKGDFESPVEPQTVLISKLDDELLGQLIRLEEVEFSRDDFEQPYADENDAIGGATNRLLEDCLGGSLILRTSIYADFMNELTPFGNGEAVGVLTVFNNTYQLFIRDTDDIQMMSDPCNRSATPAEQLPISELRSAFESGTSIAPDARYIEGTVISDVDNGNMTNRNLAIQDETGGIILRFNNSHSFQPNDILQIEVSGLALEEYQGLLQVSNVPMSRTKFITTGSEPTPNLVTIDDLLSNFEELESTLVRIDEAEFDQAGSFSGSAEFSDATGTMIMYTRSQATFANEVLPAGKVSITAVVTQGGFDEVMQVSIRSREDVTGGSTGNDDPLEELSEDFETLGDYDPVALSGWLNVAVEGTRVWQAREFSGNTYAQATAFNDTSPSMETWLVTPKLDLEKVSTLEFESAMAYYAHDGLAVYISTDFDGNDVEGANWTELSSAVIAGESDGDHTWVSSGAVDISSFSGTGYVAFRHIGNSNSGATSYRIDNIEIR